MVLRRDLDRTLRLIQTHIDKLRAWGFVAGLLYSTREGVIKTYGSPVIKKVMKGHIGEIYDRITTAAGEIPTELKQTTSVITDLHPSATNDLQETPRDEEDLQQECAQQDQSHILDQTDQSVEMAEMDWEVDATHFLPILDTRLDMNSFTANRSLASLCVRVSSGKNGKQVGWGNPDTKPIWWPEHIAWTKRGVQKGVTNESLKEIITACYGHYGHPLYDDTQRDGTEVIGVHLRNQEEWMATDETERQLEVFNDGVQDMDSIRNCDDSFFLPQLKMPVERNTFVENRKIAVNCVKISMGIVGQRVGWGLPENKPAWWPSQVPWTKRGVQQGVTNDNLKDAIVACYQYHGQPMYHNEHSNWNGDQYIWLPEEALPLNSSQENADWNESEVPSVNHAVQVPGFCIIKQEPTEDGFENEESTGNREVPVYVIKEEPKDCTSDYSPYYKNPNLSESEALDINSNTRHCRYVLPNLPRKLEDMLFLENRRLAQICVKVSLGTNRRIIGWGHPDSKPAWWPHDVPWTKRGVQMGVTNEHLKDVIRACYQYYGQPLYANEEEPQNKSEIQDELLANRERLDGVNQETADPGVLQQENVSAKNCLPDSSSDERGENGEGEQLTFEQSEDEILLDPTKHDSNNTCLIKQESQSSPVETPSLSPSVSRRSLHKNLTMPKKYARREIFT